MKTQRQGTHKVVFLRVFISVILVMLIRIIIGIMNFSRNSLRDTSHPATWTTCFVNTAKQNKKNPHKLQLSVRRHRSYALQNTCTTDSVMTSCLVVVRFGQNIVQYIVQSIEIISIMTPICLGIICVHIHGKR